MPNDGVSFKESFVSLLMVLAQVLVYGMIAVMCVLLLTVLMGAMLECDCPDATTVCCCEETEEPTSTTTPEQSETPTGTTTPTNTPVPTPTSTPEPVCYQELVHKPGEAAEQPYCCESDGCVEAHIDHGDYCVAPFNSDDC